MKLLDKSLRSSLIYASVILLIAIPVLYKVVQAIVKEDASEGLFAKKKEVALRISTLPTGKEVLSFYDPDIQVGASNAVISDRLYHILIYDSLSGEHIPYQVLEGTITAQGRIYFIRLKSSLVDREDLIISIVSIVGALIILIISGLILINRSLSRRIWKPFYNTLEQLKQFRLDRKSSLHFPRSGIDEFNTLNTTLTTLIDNNQQAYQSQKEFTENASHELQTPLAVINGNLELLMSSQPLTPGQADLISSIEQATARMNRLNKTLILLARIDNNQFSGAEQIDLKLVVENMIHQFEEAAVQKKINILSSLSKHPNVSGNKDLVDILISNLFTNAIRHNRNEGIIKLSQQDNTLRICNTGKDEPLDQTLLYKRFQKQGSVQESTGLGLALVKRICEISNYDIRYEFENGLHCFTVRFQPTS